MPRQVRSGIRPGLSIGFAPPLAGLAAVGAGVVILGAWIFGLEGVKRMAPGLPQMKANTALGLMALGTAILLLRAGRSPALGRIGRVLALAVAVFGFVVLLEYLFGAVGIDQALFRDTGPSPGRPAPHTAVVFVLVGLGLACSGLRVGRVRPTDWLLAAGAVGVLSALVGYAYDVHFLRATAGLTGIALHTALTLAVLTIGAACLRPDEGPVGYLRRDDPGAAVARHLLPAVVVGPVLLGLAHRAGTGLGVAPEMMLGLMTLAGIGVFLGLVLILAGRLSRADARRAAAEAESGAALGRFVALLRAAPDPMIVVDSRGRIENVNARAERSFGYEPGELVGRPVETLLPAGLPPAGGDPAASPSGPAPADRADPKARCKDGGEFPVEIASSSLIGDAGEAVIVAIRDVSERRRTEATLRKAAHFFEIADDLLCTASFDGWFQELNGAWEQTLGWSTDELRSRPFAEYLHPDDRERTALVVDRLVGGERTVGFRNRYRRKDGNWCWLEWNATAVYAERLIYASARDITARVYVEEARQRAEARFSQAFEEAPIGMALTDLDGRFLRVNAALCELTGYTAEQLAQTGFESITHPEDVADGVAGRRRMVSGEVGHYRSEKRYITADAEVVCVEVNVSLVRDERGEPSHFISQVVDMSDHKRFEANLQYLADHDPLTGLFNRRRFEAELSRELATASRYGSRGAVLAVDLDNFKYVNDSLGHAAGDELIAKVSSALKERLRETDVVARLGGDEFAIVLPHVDRNEALLVARDVLAIVGASCRVESGPQVSASIGIAMIEDARNVTAEELLVAADIAMYEAKEGGRDQIVICDQPGDRQHVQRRITWADRIQDAIDTGGFRLHAQPILGLQGDSTPRYELLIRMLGEDGETIPPGTFLRVAERFELIQRIDRWVVAEAIRLLADQQRHGREIRLALNLSAKSVGDPSLLDFIRSQFVRTGASPNALCFEIREAAVVIDVAHAQRFARGVKGLGCQVALDDFGAGFASFYYLEHLEFDYLKIDGEFISDLPRNPTNQIVVKALVQIARGLRKQTIAEYVADSSTMETVRLYGVDYAQGFHVARPQPIVTGRPGEPARFPSPVPVEGSVELSGHPGSV